MPGPQVNNVNDSNYGIGIEVKEKKKTKFQLFKTVQFNQWFFAFLPRECSET